MNQAKNESYCGGNMQHSCCENQSHCGCGVSCCSTVEICNERLNSCCCECCASNPEATVGTRCCS